MSDRETIICVTDDIGIRVWLERALQDTWNVEFVSNAVLSRVVNLMVATSSPLVIVAVDESAPENAVSTIEAILSRANQILSVVTVTRRLSEDTLLKCMRAGAKDCLIADADAEELHHQIEAILHRNKENLFTEDKQTPRNLTLVTSASPIVDTRFLTQSLTFSINELFPEKRILSIDTSADGRYLFYLEANNRFGLRDFLSNSNSTDEMLIDSALEEYSPGVRLMGGLLDTTQLKGEKGIDLFISITHLMRMFDKVIVNLDHHVADLWIKSVGTQIKHLVLASHPMVNQAHNTRDIMSKWRENLSDKSKQILLIDGFDEANSVPSVEQLQTAIGHDVYGTLPLDWQNRLLAINSGTPIHKLPTHSTYAHKMDNLVRQFNGLPMRANLSRRFPILQSFGINIGA